MTRYRCGDVILVEVIFSEGIGAKKRPALILSSDEYHKSRQEIIIAAITSNIRRMLLGDSKIVEWKDAGLLYPSVVTGIMQTIKARMAIRRLGELSKRDLQLVKKNLSKAIVL